MIVDSHTHLYLEEFSPDYSSAVDRAIAAGVGHLMFPNVDLGTIAPLKQLAASYPGVIDMAMGLHPTEVNAEWPAALEVIEQEARKDGYKAIGEIGLDLYWDKTFVKEQQEVFRRQCLLANELDLPIIIHCREALRELLEVFEKLEQVPRGVFHSFGGDEKDVERIRAYGDFYFGINGIVTFKNSKLRNILPDIGIDRILLETDSPYLAPVPMRGRRNESAFLVHVAAYVADSLDMTPDQVADITTRNYQELFGRF